MAVRSALLYRKSFLLKPRRKQKLQKREKRIIMDIPVYLFTGFMDSGKTSLITQTLQENDFGIGSRSLIIACEDGDEEYDEEALEKDKITVVAVESEEEFTEEYLKDCDETIKPVLFLLIQMADI